MNSNDKNNNTRILINSISITGIIICLILAITAWRTGILTSQEKMQDFVSSTGLLGAPVFVLIQIVQVVVPIIPGGVSCLAGVLMFGPLKGFLYNYTGICIGSMCAFAASKYYGRPLMRRLFSEKSLARYENWTTTRGRFAKLFALAIFSPAAPDDMLCYLAGTTSMSWRQFNLIIWLGKPFAILMYSYGLTFLYNHIIPLIN